MEKTVSSIVVPCNQDGPKAIVFINGIPVRRVQSWPITIGRSLNSNIVLDNTYLSAHHAELHWTNAGIEVHVLDSVNGIHVGQKHVVSGQKCLLSENGSLNVGGQLLTVSTVLDDMGSERSLFRHIPAVTGLCLVSLILLLLFQYWLHPYTHFEMLYMDRKPWFTPIYTIGFFMAWVIFGWIYYPSYGYPQRDSRIVLHGALITLGIIGCNAFLSLIEHAFVINSMYLLRPHILIFFAFCCAYGVYTRFRLYSSQRPTSALIFLCACTMCIYTILPSLQAPHPSHVTVIGPSFIHLAPYKTADEIAQQLDTLKGSVDDLAKDGKDR